MKESQLFCNCRQCHVEIACGTKSKPKKVHRINGIPYCDACIENGSKNVALRKFTQEEHDIRYRGGYRP